MVRRKRAAAALALGGLVACSAEPAVRPRTELILLADTDIAELTHVEFEVNGEGRGAELRRAPVRDDGAALSVGLVYSTGSLGPVIASARGYAGDQELVSRHAVVSFLEGRTLVVPLHLLRDCVSVACDATQSCTEQGCTARELPASSLAEWPSLPPDIELTQPSVDAGTDDAGVEPPDSGLAPLDAGEPDGGIDGGALDDGGVDMDAASDAQIDAAASDGATDAALGDGALDDGATDAQIDAALPDGATDAQVDGGTSCSGVVVDLTSDPNHCGTCTTVCSPSFLFPYHDVPACKNSACTWVCATGYAECNNITFLDRCETNIGTDEDNCGACGKKCKSSETCTAGVCGP